MMRDTPNTEGIFAESVTITCRNGLTALTDASFQIPKGTITAIVGGEWGREIHARQADHGLCSRRARQDPPAWHAGPRRVATEPHRVSPSGRKGEPVLVEFGV